MRQEEGPLKEFRVLIQNEGQIEGENCCFMQKRTWLRSGAAVGLSQANSLNIAVFSKLHKPGGGLFHQRASSYFQNTLPSLAPQILPSFFFLFIPPHSEPLESLRFGISELAN